MKFEVGPLPYAYDALEPYIGARTVEIHYTRHHKGYMSKLEGAIAGTSLADKSLEDIVASTDGNVYNFAAQVWNHAFYWSSMSPRRSEPSPELEAAVDRDLGGIEAFKHAFSAAASGEFGSGWAWLVVKPDGKLVVLSSTDAENPIRQRNRPLLTLDVWEHAYYLDYQNERGTYIEAFLDHLINWEHASEHYAASRS